MPASLIDRAEKLEARIDRWLEGRARRIDALGDRLELWIVGALALVFLEAAVGSAVVGWGRHAIAFGWGAVVYGSLLLLLWRAGAGLKSNGV